MATFEKIGDDYKSKLNSVKNFKIGKTGQTIKERYDEEYSKDYSNYEIIGSSEKSNTIDDFEKYMIKRFMKLSNCDNEQVGGGEMTSSTEYIVYLMYNE